jgi:transcriptional regulator with PAS, ATPase and Fis domain
MRYLNDQTPMIEALLPVLEAVVSFMDEGVIVATERGDVIYHNPSAYQLLGLPANEPIRSIKRLGPINLQKSLLRAAIEAGETDAAGRPSGQFVRFIESLNIDEDRRYLEFHSGLVRLADGATLRVVLIMDRTESQRLELVLRRGNPFGLVTRDPAMLDAISRIHQIAPTQASVLLQGESGTGKTQLARLIHSLSGRASQPFVEVNCAAIPDSLIETELFGHIKGAFTGATQDRPGRFQSANHGTLFLDEVSEIPLNLQAKLLRAIQEQEFEMVGSDKPVKVDVRILAASNKNLRDMVDEGEFRADLYYRLAVIPLNVPPLRQRKGDIALLVEHFLEQMKERGYPDDVHLGPESLRMLVDYPWPGNVRELENAIEHGIICAIDQEVRPDSLPQDIRAYVHASDLERETPDSSTESERNQILDALARTSGNRSAAARLLGIDRTTLWRKMLKHHIA